MIQCYTLNTTGQNSDTDRAGWYWKLVTRSRTASRDQAIDTVVARLESTDSAAPENPRPSTGTDQESASAAAEEDNLGGYHKDKQSEGIGNAKSCESRSRNRSGVSRGTAPPVGNHCIFTDGSKARADTIAPRGQETPGVMLPLASSSLTPDYGNELWAWPAHDSVSVSPTYLRCLQRL